MLQDSAYTIYPKQAKMEKDNCEKTVNYFLVTSLKTKHSLLKTFT